MTEPVELLRLAPASPEAEMAVLGGLLAHPAALDVVRAIIEDRHFADYRHGRIYAAMCAMADAGQQANPFTLKAWAEREQALDELGGATYLAKLAASSITLVAVRNHARYIVDMYRRRRLIAAAQFAMDRAEKVDPTQPPADLARQLQNDLQAIAVAPVTDLGLWDAGDDDYVIPPREWLLGTAFCRTFVSTLIADGAVGKTTVRIAQHLALATGKPITGEHVFLRCRTLMLCFEDDRNELRRRVYAAMQHHGIAPSDIKGWMFLGTIRQGDMKLALLDNYGNAIRGPLDQVLADEIRSKGIDLVTLDPFVKTHALEENSNPHMDFVTGMLAEMASMLNIATDLTHHTSKGPADAGNADRGRGASSAKNAGRLVKTLAGMTTEEAQAFDVADADRRSLVRMDNGKVNLAAPAIDAQWLRLVSVNLGNKTDIYPHGDEVQAVEVWEPPGKTAGLSHYVLNQILDRIDAGLDGGERYSAASAADVRAVWPVFAELAPTCSDKQGRRIVKDWLDSGALYYRLYKSPKFRKERQGLYVNSGKRPS